MTVGARATRRALCPFVVLLALAPSQAAAVPGPDSVCVVANAAVEESVDLARLYAEARDVPRRQVCLLDLPEVTDITLDELRTLLLDPLDRCLEDGGARDRVEAVVLIRGVPLRVAIPSPGGDALVSLAAALEISRSTLSDGTPLLGEPPGRAADCGGTPCSAALWLNPFSTGTFEPGWSRSVGGVDHRLLLVTMLHGRSYEDAALLVQSALDAEASGGASGEFLLMEGADAARGALDGEYAFVAEQLASRGYDDVAVEPFDSALTGRSLAAFFTGTATLGATIEGNAYLPGSLVDNLTSFGAVPENFEPEGESQVSIARWVAMGVAGVHGTTAEPLNNVFPSRRLIVDYVDGSTLAEAFHRNLPYVYWHNLVLGDPMAAPYAVRPVVTIDGVADGDAVADARTIVVSAEHPERDVASLVLLVDGEVVAEVDGPGPIEHCLALPAGETDVQVLAVAQTEDDGTLQGVHRPKGWLSLRVDGAAGRDDCAENDGGPDADADVSTDADLPGDAETPPGGDTEPGGCACRAGVGGGRVAPLAAALLAALALAVRALRSGPRRRSRRRPGRPRCSR